MDHIVLITLPEEFVLPVTTGVSELFAGHGLIDSIDYDIQTGRVGDPLPRKTRDSSDSPSPKQWKLLNWKMGVLEDLVNQARRAEDIDEVTLNFGREVLYVASVEIKDDKADVAHINKSRMHSLIDAVLDAIKDLEFELAEA